jgi:hypothetical protein
MADGAKSTKISRSEDRRQRLAAELRANLGKRKAQARAKALARADTGRAPVHQGADNPTENDD